MGTFGKKLIGRGYPFPCFFGHKWTAEQILKRFPETRLCLILRDPLSRLVSGFYSRLRAGRPTYNSAWSMEEAAAFSIFRSHKDLLNAMISDDEFTISALQYAMENIRHLRWNYSFYFTNPDIVRKNADRFALIGDISSVPEFITSLTGLSGAPLALADELYAKSHESGGGSGSPLEGYNQDEIHRMKEFLGKEYRIYDELKLIADSKKP